MTVLSFNIVLINAHEHLLLREVHAVNNGLLMSARRTNVYTSQSWPDISPPVSVDFNFSLSVYHY